MLHSQAKLRNLHLHLLVPKPETLKTLNPKTLNLHTRKYPFAAHAVASSQGRTTYTNPVTPSVRPPTPSILVIALILVYYRIYWEYSYRGVRGFWVGSQKAPCAKPHTLNAEPYLEMNSRALKRGSLEGTPLIPSPYIYIYRDSP